MLEFFNMRDSTILENSTASPIEVKSESAAGVHTLITTIRPWGMSELRVSSGDTYLNHWVVVGNAPVVSFSSDDLADNRKIKFYIVDGSYSRQDFPRHGDSRPATTARNERSQSVGAGSDVGRLRRLWSVVVSLFIRRSPEANPITSVNSEPNHELIRELDSVVRTVHSEPITVPTAM